MAARTPDILAGLVQGGDDALGAAMGPQVMALDIAVIRLDGGTQPRAGMMTVICDACAERVYIAAQSERQRREGNRP